MNGSPFSRGIVWLTIAVRLVACAQGAITDLVDFNSGALTDRFAINIETSPSPYSLAANGLGGSPGVDLGPSGDATLVYKTKAFGLAEIPSLDVSCFFKKQATSANFTALTFALVGASTSRVNSYDAAGTLEDAYASLRLGRSGSSLRLEAQLKAGNTATPVNATPGASLSLTDGKWYQLRATFVRVDANTIRVSGSLWNSDASGQVGTQVSSFAAVDLTVPDIAGVSQVWVAVRGFATSGADAWDHLSITQNGVDEKLPAAPGGLTATPRPGHRMDLAWFDASNNEDLFVVSRASSENGPFTDIATLLANATSFSDNFASVPARFFYRVRAVNADGAASTSAVVAVTLRTRYMWKNVAIGGGGYITGIYLHPLEPDLVYLRTDVGGCYRWDATNVRWIPITDHFTLPQADYYYPEALALDPQHPNVVYIAAGNSLRPGAMFKSLDRGATWTQLPVGSSIEMHGNGVNRASGERLVVSPHDANLLIYGTRSDGLLRSTDAGATWAKATNFPDAAWTAGSGFNAVLFDPFTAGIIYAAPEGFGVWRSTDNGATWTQLANAPLNVYRMVIGTAGALLAAHSGGVSKYAGGTWTTTVPGGTAMAFRAISVNPVNRDDVIVADTRTDGNLKTYRSGDGGATWTAFARDKSNQVPWLDGSRMSNNALASMEFDPAVPGRVWLSDWYGVWRTEDIDASSPLFRNDMYGLEEVVVFTLAAPATGPLLLSGVADNDGFRHTNGLDIFPDSRLPNNRQETHSLAIYAGDPARLARATAGRSSSFRVLTSTDSGATWATTNWHNAVPGARALQLAIAATDPNNIVAITDRGLADGGIARVTTDGGVTWPAVTGLPVGPFDVWYVGVSIASDPLAAHTFYYHDAATGRLLRSTDKGLTFTEANVGAPLPTSTARNILRGLPGATGDLWTCIDGHGLYRSTNAGASFTRIPTVTRAYTFAFGKSAPGSTTPTLYLYGTVTGASLGVFRSLDLGQTWSELTDLAEAMGNSPGTMEASAQEFGLVFIGTSGRGIFYGRPVPTVSVSINASGSELGPTPGSFTLARDGDLTASVSVGFSLGGSAIAGSDYVTPAAALTIPATAASNLLTIAPYADLLSEGAETVTLSLAPSPDYLVGPDATLAIADRPFDAWRANWFTQSELNDPTVSDDLADPNANGLTNVLEFALSGIPKGSSSAAQPQFGIVTGHLTLSFTRNATAADLTYTVQASDSLGPWTDLATSSIGGSWDILVNGTTVSQAGTGSTRTVVITDPVSIDDPAHPRRFLRLQVARYFP
jgi:hypothetical protein